MQGFAAPPPSAPGHNYTPARQLLGTVPTKKKIQDALLVFAKEGNIEGAMQAIEMLSETNSKTKALNAKHHGGYAPIHAAARHGQTDMVKLLAKNGADVLQKTDFGKTAIQLAQLRGHDATVAVLNPIAKLQALKLEKARRAALKMDEQGGGSANSPSKPPQTEKQRKMAMLLAEKERRERVKEEEERKKREAAARAEDGIDESNTGQFELPDGAKPAEPAAAAASPGTGAARNEALKGELEQLHEDGEADITMQQRMGLIASFHLLMLQGFEAKRLMPDGSTEMWVLYTDLGYCMLYVGRHKGDPQAEAYRAKEMTTVKAYSSDRPILTIILGDGNSMSFEVDDLSARDILIDMFRMWAEKGYCKWNRLQEYMKT